MAGVPRDPARPRYRVIAVSLYEHEALWLELMTATLRRAGNPKANRSLVVREALLRLEEALGEKTPDEVLRDFIEHHVGRTTKSDALR